MKVPRTMARHKYIYEVIDAAKEAKTKKEKIRILKENESWALKDVLKGTLDPKIQWELPGGVVPYEPAEEYNHPSNLLKENVKFKYFVKGGPARDMANVKREMIFIGILEGIHPADALLLVSMINKESFGGGITAKLVNEAFVGLVNS